LKDSTYYSYANFNSKVVNTLYNENLKGQFWNRAVFTYFVNDNPELKAKAELEYTPETRSRVVNKRIGFVKLKEILQKNDRTETENLIQIFINYKEKFLKTYKPVKGKITIIISIQFNSYDSFRDAVIEKCGLQNVVATKRKRFWEWAYRFYVKETKATIKYDTKD
jgi:hypothetical protein